MHAAQGKHRGDAHDVIQTLDKDVERYDNQDHEDENDCHPAVLDVAKVLSSKGSYKHEVGERADHGKRQDDNSDGEGDAVNA